MEPLAVMMTLSARALTTEAHSALPDAPVVPAGNDEPAAFRARSATAGLLRRLADAVAPPPRARLCLPVE
jgi:hypothetical protein